MTDKPAETERSVAETAAALTRQRDEEIAAAIRLVLSSASGRRVYAYLLDASGVYADAPREEPERTAFIGRRALGLDIVRRFRDAAPDLCYEAETEDRHRRATEDATLADARRREREKAERAAPFYDYDV